MNGQTYTLYFGDNDWQLLKRRVFPAVLREADAIVQRRNQPGWLQRVVDATIMGHWQRHGPYLFYVPTDAMPAASAGPVLPMGRLPPVPPLPKPAAARSRAWVMHPDGQAPYRIEAQRSAWQALQHACCYVQMHQRAVTLVNRDDVYARIAARDGEWAVRIHALPAPVTPTPPTCPHGMGFHCPTCWPKPPTIR